MIKRIESYTHRGVFYELTIKSGLAVNCTYPDNVHRERICKHMEDYNRGVVATLFAAMQTLVYIQPVVGMAGGRSRALICTQCSCPASPLSRPSSTHQQTAHRTRTRLFTWPWFRDKRDAPLPEPEQAVALVEQFLKRQLKP